jgi:outer membrane protein assembly factor BamB
MAKSLARQGARPACALVAVASLAGLASAMGAAGPAVGAIRTVHAGRSTAAQAARSVGPADWPAYLDGPAHTSDNLAQVAITPANAAALVQKWHFVGDPPTQQGQPGPTFNASPTVADGAVFIGSRTGWFYKLDESTGQVLDKVFFGYQPHHTCTAGGLIATATVAKDPSDGQDTVYVGAPDGYLYALRASDLSVKWKSVIAIPSTTVSDYFQWSSPTVANGRIYIGVSSHCDKPLIRGGVIGYVQATGKIFGRYFDVPKGVVGGSVWSSVAAGNRYVFVTTGNAADGATVPYDTVAVVELRAKTLSRVAKFRPPASQLGFDRDFGASPARFGTLVGACNKNGLFYALHVPSMMLAWERRVATSPGTTPRPTCLAASVYDGKHLYVAATATTIAHKTVQGSIRQLDPATGRVLWQTGLPNGVLGSPSLDGAGVLAVGTYGANPTPNAVYLLSARTGHILRTLIIGGHDFAQSTFADGMLFTANDTGVYAWGP